MVEIVWCFKKIHKSQIVNDSFIFPSYGDKVNEFNEMLRVVGVENKGGKIFIELDYIWD